MTKEALSTTFPNIRHTRAPQAKYNAKAGVQQELLQRLGYRIVGETISLYDSGKLLATVASSVKDMGGFDDEQPLWIGEQLYYDVSSGDPKVIFIPGVKFTTDNVLIYDDMPELSAPITIDENGLFTIREITVIAN